MRGREKAVEALAIVTAVPCLSVLPGGFEICDHGLAVVAAVAAVAVVVVVVVGSDHFRVVVGQVM